MNRKTLQLLLTNYNAINNQLRSPCAEKTKFEKLIIETHNKLMALPPEVVYPNGMTAMEFAKDLAQKANSNG
tara:strand:+ start:2261 stop:2476 length:216 start_codon:yes stop_codon:yes gene_type:complete